MKTLGREIMLVGLLAGCLRSQPLPMSPVHPVAARTADASSPDSTGGGAAAGDMLDSLEAGLLSLELTKAEQLVAETDFWHRLLPRITLSAAWGIREVVFVDPYATVQPLAPKDSYRLGVTLALGDVLDFGRHVKAELDLMSLQTRLHMLHARQEAAKIETRRRLDVSTEQMRLLQEERKIVVRLLEFTQLEYAMGKIAFDALQRAHLQLLAVDRSIIALRERMENGGRHESP